MKNFTVNSIKIISKHLSVFYFFNCKLIIFQTNQKRKYLKINPNLYLLFLNNKILIFTLYFNKLSKFKTKQIKAHKKLLLNNFKKTVTEIKNNFFNKLKLVGIGFKLFLTKFHNVLSLKLGFSHFIFFKIHITNFNIKILKDTQLFIKSPFFSDIKNLFGLIRKLKFPEIYKGKGIFYANEKILLKKGKKV